MKAVSLFAGIGGFDLALERASINTTATVEYDKNAQAVLAHHYPHTTHLTDITKVTADDIRATGFNGADGILTGGFPCQSYSIAGHRRGLGNDERGQLWWDMHRLIEGLKPRWVVGENVPGLLSSHNGEDFETIIASLVEVGYSVAWRVLDARYFGVAQRRRRVFIVGHLGAGADPSEILFEPEGSRRDNPTSRETRQDTTGTLGGGSGSRGWTPDVTHTLPARHDSSEDGCGRGTPIIPDTARCLTTSNERIDYETETFITIPATTTPPHAAFTSRGLQHDYSEEIFATLTASQERGVMTPTAVRRLTPTECERLQGFPDDWTAGQTDSHRYRQLGNAVAVPVAQWIINRIKNTQ